MLKYLVITFKIKLCIKYFLENNIFLKEEISENKSKTRKKHSKLLKIFITQLK